MVTQMRTYLRSSSPEGIIGLSCYKPLSCLASAVRNGGDMLDRIRTYCELTGMSIDMFALIAEVAEFNATLQPTLKRLERTRQKGFYEFPGGAELTLGASTYKSAEHEINIAVSHGYLEIGMPSLQVVSESILDLWRYDEVEVNSETVMLSPAFRHEWPQIERSVLQIPVMRQRVLPTGTLLLSNMLPIVGNSCSVMELNPDPAECPLLSPQSTDNGLGLECVAFTVDRWRADWWRDPIRGYGTVCARDYHFLEMLKVTGEGQPWYDCLR